MLRPRKHQLQAAIVGVDNLKCRILELLSAECYADLYEVNCTAVDWQPYAAYRWIADSGCTLPFEVQCQLDDILAGVTTEVANLSASTSCAITVTDNSTTPSCAAVLITTIK